MTYILINYSVKEEWADDNVRLIDDLIRQLKENAVKGISHSVYKMGRSSFIHICRYADLPACEEATSFPAFKMFLNTLEKIVDQEPIVNNIEEIGYYAPNPPPGNKRTEATF
jgi:hypothetical protein